MEHTMKVNQQQHDLVLEQLMQNYGQDILQLVYTYVKSQAIAEDLTQEIFMKCYHALPHFKGNSTYKTWLWRIAINHTKDFLKSWYNNHVEPATQELLHEVREHSNVEQAVIQYEDDAKLAASVMALPLIYREVIYLFYFEEYALKEISTMLSLNLNTVKTRLRKGKALIKKRLEEQKWTN